MAPPLPKRPKTSAAPTTSTSFSFSWPWSPTVVTNTPIPGVAVSAASSSASSWTSTISDLLNPFVNQGCQTQPRSLVATPTMPPDWMNYYNDTVLSLESFQKFPVAEKSMEYDTIVKLLAPTQVISAEKVVNPKLWQTYINTRKEMMRAKTNDVSLLSNLGLDERELMHCTHTVINYARNPLLETEAGKYSPNEALLFHCTKSKQNLDKILHQGLDERFGLGGLLGKGIYFSDDPQKSMLYDFGGTGVILIFSVLLGDCLFVERTGNVGQFVREPEKEQAQKRNPNDQFFDSITSGLYYNEYVIYNRHQCCPIYMVKYQRSSAASSTMTFFSFTRDERDNYAKSRRATSPLAWKKLPGAKSAMPNQDFDGNLPFFALSVFEKMGVVPVPDNVTQSQPKLPIMDDDSSSITDLQDLVDDTTTTDRLAALANLGFVDDAKNREALKRYDNKLEQTVNFLMDSAVT